MSRGVVWRPIYEMNVVCLGFQTASGASSKLLLGGLTTDFASRRGAGAAREKEGYPSACPPPSSPPSRLSALSSRPPPPLPISPFSLLLSGLPDPFLLALSRSEVRVN